MNKNSFLNKYFFYRVSKEEKKNIRTKIIEEDQNIFTNTLLIIIALQILMLVLSVIRYGFLADGKTYIHAYRILYIALIVSCAVSIPLSKFLKDSKKDFEYFALINSMLVISAVWSAGISILDSHNGIDLTTYAYVIMAIPLLLIVEPWISFIDLSVISMAMIMHFSLKGVLTVGTVINVLSILALSVVSSTLSFYRRIRKLNLEIEITDLNKQLTSKSELDALTGLYNRRYLTEHINDPVEGGFSPTGVMMLDIDHFKKINDIYGHNAGDIVLEKLGLIIKEFATDSGYAVRYGGEEFMIKINSISKDEILNQAEVLRKIVEESNVKINKNTSIKYTVSIGCSIGNNKISYAGLIAEADKALYVAKKTRNTSYLSEE